MKDKSRRDRGLWIAIIGYVMKEELVTKFQVIINLKKNALHEYVCIIFFSVSFSLYKAWEPHLVEGYRVGSTDTSDRWERH